jgi:hypothetical protein
MESRSAGAIEHAEAHAKTGQKAALMVDRPFWDEMT